MFPSFTGSARPKRQVNLSGRNSNPFAAHAASGTTASSQPTPNALAQIQHDRLQRQQERERPPAATRIQKTWRGHKGRKGARTLWRREWNDLERWESFLATKESFVEAASAAFPYGSEAECLASLRLLIQFASARNDHDIQRLYYFATRYLKSVTARYSGFPADVWTYPLLRLAKLVLNTLDTNHPVRLPTYVVDRLLSLLYTLTTAIPSQLAPYSLEYFRTLAALAVNQQNGDVQLIEQCAVRLLQSEIPRTGMAYKGFVSEFLTMAGLPHRFGNLKGFARGIEYNLLADALNSVMALSSPENVLKVKNRESLLWLLAYFIYFRHWSYSNRTRDVDLPDALYVKIVSRLVSFLADDIGSRMDPPTVINTNKDASLTSTSPATQSLPEFVRLQILTLITQDNVTSLLANIDITSDTEVNSSTALGDASSLASYALTLLRAFPRRGDEIRMWLYRGSTPRQSRQAVGGRTLPAIKYFYQTVSKTEVYKRISGDPKDTVKLLRPDKSEKSAASSSSSPIAETRDQQWRVILLFLELYTFVLKVMDDEEFLSGTMESSAQWSWTRQSALPLNQVKSLTLFLKNLAFAMYWNASDIGGIEAMEAKTSLAEYFGGSKAIQPEKSQDQHPSKSVEISVAGVSGMTLAYIKGMVTGVLRMVYERDSRRKLMPRDHWLMTKYFEMGGFIAAVVSEEEYKHQLEESYGADGEANDTDSVSVADEADHNDHNLIGTRHTQRVRNAERLQKQQRKAFRRKYLESVTPRLEILQNMPFFIPFATRVQIFRQFVLLDQTRRRGTTDPDHWRFNMMNSPTGNIGRHQAKVRRESIFDDAFSQYYDLGEGLKEPIQIRFVDKFDTIEEGIDGGGVTKEFLTSITNEAFSASNGLEALFIENDQNLLYPNPASLEERKATLHQALVKENSPTWNESVRDLLRRYEFLGRIIGKCLYEGILVDIHFAPFFLLKWALTGGSTTAGKESSYRANLNDLRDLDEGLYQGLLQLKNYDGNVEDFSLNFAVTDTIHTSPTTAKTITRELRPGGENIPVTNENRLVYISFMARYRLQVQPAAQTSAFLKGLSTIIAPSWLSMFNQSEIQTLVGGSSSSIDISDLRNNTQYGGIYAIGDDGTEHPSVQMFWKVMEDLDDGERKKVLKFVTSTPRAPLLGFGNLNPRFSIRDSGSDQTRLPSTSTCVNLLKLPVFRDEKVLKERLLYSVNAGAGFNLS